MNTPHPDEIIRAVNSLGRDIIFRDGHGYLGQDIYCLKFTVKDKVAMCDHGTVAMFPDYIRLMADQGFGLVLLDRRKKKRFKFADYGDVQDLAADLSGYILDTVDHYRKDPPIVKQLLRRINKRVVQILINQSRP